MSVKKLQNRFAIFFFIALFAFSSFAQTAQQQQQAIYTRARTFDVQHYVIRVRFDRANRTVFGDTTVRVKPLKDNFKTLELDAANLNFQSISLEGEYKNLVYKIDGEKVFVTLDRAYTPNDLVSVRFKYSTVQPKKGVYFVDAEKDENGQIVRDAQIWTQGEAEEAHFWFPSYDFPDDKATSEQFITVERDETAIGNGELLETFGNASGARTFHYKMPVAHSSYLTSFVVGKYTKYSDDYKNVPLAFYVYATENSPLGFTVLPDGKRSVPTAFVKTAEMMRVYEELTGVAFPFNKYDQTIVAKFNFGGMENITATTLADTELYFSPAGSTLDLISHELAHSWFGNLVTCKNWSELWLNESFATFMEAAYREQAFGRADYLRAIREDARQFIVSDAVFRPKRGLFFAAALPDEELFSVSNAAITYKKGGAVIHSLRETVGTENFWKAINLYLNRHKFQNVESVDLQKAMEEVSGQNLNWFFSQWVYGAGYPKLSVKHVYNPKTKMVTFTVSQTQKADAKTASAFRLSMVAEVKTANGVVARNIEISKRVETFNIKVDEKPTKIILDSLEQIPLKTVKYL